MIQEKLKELELQLNYVCYDKELITRLSKVWDAYYDLKSEVKKLNLLAVSVNEVEFCTCGNPSKEGNIQIVNDEELLYFCCDCGKQVQN